MGQGCLRRRFFFRKFEIGPVRLIRDDPVYEVLPAHLELLAARGFSYEVVPSRPRRSEKRRHGTAD